LLPYTDGNATIIRGAAGGKRVCSLFYKAFKEARRDPATVVAVCEHVFSNEHDGAKAAYTAVYAGDADTAHILMERFPQFYHTPDIFNKMRRAACRGNAAMVMAYLATTPRCDNSEAMLLNEASSATIHVSDKVSRDTVEKWRMARRKTVMKMMCASTMTFSPFTLSDACHVTNPLFDPVVVRMLARRVYRIDEVFMFAKSSVAVRLFSKYVSRGALEKAIDEGAIKFELTPRKRKRMW
jgi:hypothetical protein